jgi:hypothetical protein
VRPTSRLELDWALAYVDLQASRINADATAYAGTPVVTPISYDAEARGNAFIISASAKVRF